MRILFCGESFPEALRYLEKRLSNHAPSHDEIVACHRTTLRAAVENADVVIPFMSRIDAALMDAGRFRLVHQWGAGLEGVDLEAARQRGIRVANVPASGNNADSVAEHAVLLTIALLRDLPKCQAHVREGLLGIPIGKMLAGRTVCLYGLGAIGRALARRLRPFGVRLVGITRDPAASKVAEIKLDACYSVADRNACLAQTDVLILCSRMTLETRGTIDAAVFRAMPVGSYLVNAARGGLVDYDALHASLRGGRLAGAGLDVYWDEPISPNDPLLALPNVIATPHIAGVTDRSYADIAEVVANNLDRLRRGVELVNRVV
ncbi:MAG TPA: 2-hydroxyacid dehydrogenase [Bryobacteraceae bacterium]|nr:2-hydroxyacid dehydrogenase [Bryobacteraceae bacterium]